MRDFLIKKSTIIKLVALAVLMLIVLGHVGLCYLLSVNPLDSVRAQEKINFNQEIKPFNPVSDVSSVKKSNAKTADLSSSGYRPIISLPVGNENTGPSNSSEYVAAGSLLELEGAAIYPNSPIFLEIHSNQFATTVLSDSEGKWNWTNYGLPLEPGKHTVVVYGISPFEISGKRDVSIQKYEVDVQSSDYNAANPSVVLLAKENYSGNLDSGFLAGVFLNGQAGNEYLFDTVLLGEKTYNPGDTLKLQLSFSPIGSANQDGARQAHLAYEIFEDKKNQALGEPITSFSDDVDLEGPVSFLKEITLKNNLLDGDYILKATARIGDRDHIQIARFNVSSKTVIQLGGIAVTQEKFTKVAFFNILVILTFFCVVLILVVLEFRRFLVYSPIDENVLKRRKYFKQS